MRPAEASRHVLAALEGAESVAEVVVVGGPHLGERMLVWESRTLGGLGDPAIDSRAIETARRALQGRAAGTFGIEVGGLTHSVYVEAHRPAGRLVILGAGHIARPLARLGALLGYRVTVVDDRPEFAVRERFPEAERVVRIDASDPFREIPIDRLSHIVLVTRGHRYDFDALRDLLSREAEPAYIGMVGSRRRVRAAFEQLAQAGVPPERLRGIHSPIGLDVGAETPEEIAVAIAAELVLTRRGGSGRPLRDVERVVGRWIDPPGPSGPGGTAQG